MQLEEESFGGAFKSAEPLQLAHVFLPSTKINYSTLALGP
jgi:hypothetical protein